MIHIGELSLEERGAIELLESARSYLAEWYAARRRLARVQPHDSVESSSRARHRDPRRRRGSEDGMIHIRIVGGRFVTVLPPGTAHGAFDLRNRGLDLVVEVTCWPNPGRHPLTTGGSIRDFAPIWRGQTAALLAISELATAERALDRAAEESGDFRERWRAEAVARRLRRVRNSRQLLDIIRAWRRESRAASRRPKP